MHDAPSQTLTFCVDAGPDGAAYEVSRATKPLIARSALGLTLQGLPGTPVDHIAGVSRSATDQTWEQPWGEQRLVRDHHNEMRVSLAGAGDALPYDLVVRVFDDGFGFRYDVKTLKTDQAVAITDEVPGADVLRAKVLTVSDGVARGVRDDLSGRALVDRLAAAGFDVVDHRVIADGADLVVELPAPLDAERLGHRDLDALDVVAVPDGL